MPINSLHGFRNRAEQIQRDFAASTDADELRETLCEFAKQTLPIVDCAIECRTGLEQHLATINSIIDGANDLVMVRSEDLEFARLSAAKDAATVAQLSECPEVKECFARNARMIQRMADNARQIRPLMTGQD